MATNGYQRLKIKYQKLEIERDSLALELKRYKRNESIIIAKSVIASLIAAACILYALFI